MIRVILMAAALVSGSCAFDQVPNEGDKLLIYPGDKIVMVGDSITTNTAPFFYWWWDQYQGSIDLFYTSRGLTPPTWVDKGIGGGYTATIQMDAVVNEVIAEAPDVVICEIGTNDPRSIPEANSVVNLNTWFDKLYAGVPTVRVMLMTPAFNFEEPQFPNSTWDSLAAAWRQIARERAVPCVDLRSYFNYTLTADQQDALSTDGTHPSNPVGRAWWSARALFSTNLREARP